MSYFHTLLSLRYCRSIRELSEVIRKEGIIRVRFRSFDVGAKNSSSTSGSLAIAGLLWPYCRSIRESSEVIRKEGIVRVRFRAFDVGATTSNSTSGSLIQQSSSPEALTEQSCVHLQHYQASTKFSCPAFDSRLLVLLSAALLSLLRILLPLATNELQMAGAFS